MSKYDFEIDLSEGTSTGIILSKIKKGSKVLEFGCATGRMTKYMKEALGCQVYIVEFEKSAYDIAVNYAEDGVCDDILHFVWYEKFRDIRFDAIIFADVLEHLLQPEEALKRAAQLLEEDGKIHISIPNITHNDIWLKAYEERFDYTATGLLDDTHVHFWGLNNLKVLAADCGLNISQLRATYCATGATEQYNGKCNVTDSVLLNYLRERKCGEIYQFVFSLDKSTDKNIQVELKKPSIQSCIYLDTGNDFSEKEVIRFEALYTGHGSYRLHYVIDCTKKLKRLRLDPIEFQGCILTGLSILQGGELLVPSYPSYVKLEDGVLLPGKDPMVIVECTDSGAPIVIDAELILAGAAYVNILEENCEEKQQQCQKLTGDNRSLQTEVGKLNEANLNLHTDNTALECRLAELQNSNAQLQEEIARLMDDIACLQKTNQNLQVDLGAYIVLANNKDKLLIEKDKELAEKDRELDYYRNLKMVILQEKIKTILRKFKRFICRLLKARKE